MVFVWYLLPYLFRSIIFVFLFMFLKKKATTRCCLPILVSASSSTRPMDDCNLVSRQALLPYVSCLRCLEMEKGSWQLRMSRKSFAARNKDSIPNDDVDRSITEGRAAFNAQSGGLARLFFLAINAG